MQLDQYEVNFALRRLASQHYDRLAAMDGLGGGGGSGEGDCVDNPTAAVASPAKRVSADAAEEAVEAAVEAGGQQEQEGEEGEAYEESWGPLELHAISERLKSARPLPDQLEDRRHDFANVADRACQLASLRVRGSHRALGASNIIPNELRFDLLAFRSLTRLCLLDLPCRKLVTAVGQARKTLRRLTARRCELEALSELLVGSEEEEEEDDGRPRLAWEALEELDLADNDIREIDG